MVRSFVLSVLLLAACEKTAAPPPAAPKPLLRMAVPPGPMAAVAGKAAVVPAPGPAATPLDLSMTVTEKGFEPSGLAVQKDRPVRLTITRKTDSTCAKAIVIKDVGVRADLPLDQPVTVTFTPKQAGELRYTCGMGMVGGVLAVK